MSCAAQGKTSEEIAFALGISERTVKAHLGSIYQKLGVDSRAAAMHLRRGEAGWINTIQMKEIFLETILENWGYCV